MHVLLPVKSLDHAKSRLQHVLDHGERRELAERLLNDSLTTLCALPWIDRVVVVTSNGEVAERATQAGAVIVDETGIEPDNRDPHGALNAALEAGRAWIIDDGASTVASIPVDLPLIPALDAGDLHRALDLGSPSAHALADRPATIWIQTDDRKDGTNLLVQRPPDCLAFRYGAASFVRHRRQAERRGAEVVEIDLPVLRWDLDQPDDPSRWAAALDRSGELRALYHRARDRGTALRFLERTAWGEPLRDLRP